MAAIYSDEFKRDAVRSAQTRGLTRRQVASDLGIGHSTLGKWVRVFSEEAKVPAQDAELLCENERLRKENRILRDMSRIRKQSGGLFSRRMWEALKKRRCSSRPKSREVSIYCRRQRQPDPWPFVPPDGGDGARAPCLEAQATVPTPATRHGALGAYPRSAPVELGQLRSASHDRGAERTWPSSRTTPCGATDAPERHSGCSDPQVQGGGGSENDPGDHFPEDAPTAIIPST